MDRKSGSEPTDILPARMNPEDGFSISVPSRLEQKARWTVEIDSAGGNESITYDLLSADAGGMRPYETDCG
jgi:hypothetical protein